MASSGVRGALTGSFTTRPSGVLSLALVAVAVGVVLVALFGHPLLKAAVLAWVLLP